MKTTTKEINVDDLLDVEMDLHGVVALLTLLESSEYYREKEEEYLCRALRNNVEQIDVKLKKLME